MKSTDLDRREPPRVFFAVRRWLADGADGVELTHLQRAVLQNLASFMDANGHNGRPTNDLLATITGGHRDSVSRSLRQLRELGFIEPTIDHPHTGRPQVWRIPKIFASRLAGLSKEPNREKLRSEMPEIFAKAKVRTAPALMTPMSPPRNAWLSFTGRLDFPILQVVDDGTELESRGLVTVERLNGASNRYRTCEATP